MNSEIKKRIHTLHERSSDCCMALRFAWAQVAKVQTALDAGQVDFADIRQML